LCAATWLLPVGLVVWAIMIAIIANDSHVPNGD
jgi:hypothetical protein